MAWRRPGDKPLFEPMLVSLLIHIWITQPQWINTLRPRQNGRHFADDTFKRIFLSENVGISNEISLKFVDKGPINNIPALVQMMAWRRPGDKPLSEPMVVRLPTHICVTRPQWVNSWDPDISIQYLVVENYDNKRKLRYWIWSRLVYVSTKCESIAILKEI